MPTFNIDSARTIMVATGKVTAVLEWIEGSPRGADRPAKRDPNSGFPLWLVDCLIDDDSARSAVAGVEVPAMDAPIVKKFQPVAFEGLSVSCYVQRNTGALVTRWAAEGLANGKPAAVAS